MSISIHPVCARLTSSDDGTEHDRLVGLVFEVSIPQLVEFGSHLLQLLFGGANFEPGIDGVGGEPSALRAGFPLVENLRDVKF